MGDKFTTRGFATRGEFVTHSWGYFATRGGIGDVPFVIHRGFSIHRLGASPLVNELPRPYFFSIRDSAICFWRDGTSTRRNIKRKSQGTHFYCVVF